MRSPLLLTLLLLLFAACSPESGDISISREEAAQIGEKIFLNECGGEKALLTSWNTGEAFPSLGIGHFIWYPTGSTGPFAESFPKLVRYIEEQDISIPPWLNDAANSGAPWSSRAVFIASQNTGRMKQLRRFLIETKHLQTRFMIRRLNRALPTILAAASNSQRAHIEKQFQRVAAASMGYYALIDYVNFKGEGVKPSERYQGQGWGLLQVLMSMDDSKAPLSAFAEAADRVLTRRVELSPPERNEARWLAGWRNRLATYTSQAN